MVVRNNRKRPGFYNICYFLLWTFLTVSYILFRQTELVFLYDEISPLYYNILKVIGTGAYSLVLSRERISRKETAVFLIIAAVLGIVSYRLRSTDLFVLCGFVLAGEIIDLDALIRYDIKIKTILFFLVITLCEMGVLPNYASEINGSYKQALGFTHPNVLSALFFTILLEYIYIRYEKFNFFDAAVLLLGTTWIYTISASRSSVFTFLAVLALVIVAKIFPALLHTGVIKELLSLLPSILTVLSLLLVRLYKNGSSIAIALNRAMTERIYAAESGISKYGLSLFGQIMETYGTRTAASRSPAAIFNIDMSYIAIPVQYGLVPLMLLLVGDYLLIHNALNAKNHKLAIAVVFFVLLGFGETYYYKIEYNFTMVTLLSILKKRKHMRSENSYMMNGRRVRSI